MEDLLAVAIALVVFAVMYVLELIDHERYDRIVAAATANNGDGFSADDVAWLLDRAPGEIVILRTGSRV
jgi:hypothetical protein